MSNFVVEFQTPQLCEHKSWAVAQTAAQCQLLLVNNIKLTHILYRTVSKLARNISQTFAFEWQPFL